MPASVGRDEIERRLGATEVALLSVPDGAIA